MEETGSAVPCDIVIRATITRADGTVEEVGIIAADYGLTPELQEWWEREGKAEADARARAANEAVA